MGQHLYKGHPSWRSPTMLKFVFASLFTLLFFGAFAYVAAQQDLIETSASALIIASASAFVGGSTFLYRNKTLYLVTSRGVRYEAGFPVKTDKREYSYHKVQAVNVHQSLLEKLVFKTGTVTISSAASDVNQDDIVFVGVADPDRVAGLIRDGEDRAHSNSSSSYADDRFRAPTYDRRPQLDPRDPRDARGGYGRPAPYGDRDESYRQGPYGLPPR